MEFEITIETSSSDALPDAATCLELKDVRESPPRADAGMATDLQVAALRAELTATQARLTESNVALAATRGHQLHLNAALAAAQARLEEANEALAATEEYQADNSGLVPVPVLHHQGGLVEVGALGEVGGTRSPSAATPIEEGGAETTWLRGLDGKPIWAIRREPGLHTVTLTPVEEDGDGRSKKDAGNNTMDVQQCGGGGGGGGGSVILRDEVMLLDRMHRQCPRATEIFLATSDVRLAGLLCAIGVLVGGWSFPIAFIEMTNSTQVLFGNTNSLGPFLNTSTRAAEAEAEGPWSSAVGEAATVMFSILIVGPIYWFMFVIVFFAHPVMLRRLWAKEWPAIVAKTGTSWAYAITASTIQPHYTHVLFLVFWNIVIPVYVLLSDAFAVTAQLRMHPDSFQKLIGDRDNKHNSKFAKLFLLGCGCAILFDIARHYLIVNVSKDIQLITLNVTNPFNGRHITFDNTELASALFWTSTMFLAQTVFAGLTNKMYQQTIVDVTNYHIRRG